MYTRLPPPPGAGELIIFVYSNMDKMKGELFCEKHYNSTRAGKR